MGYKPLSQEVKNSLKTKKVKTVRRYSIEGATTTYRSLIESFTKKDFDTYDSYYRKWGRPGTKRPDLVAAMERDEVLGPPLELAKLRADSAYDHQKVWQSIRYRWTEIYSYHQQRINSTEDAVWKKLARGVLGRMREYPRLRHNEWGNTDKEIIDSLVKFFKEKYKTQNGVCAISKVPLQLAVGTDVENKCSIDRIDSSKPYTKKNIQLVAFWANVMKLDTSLKQFLKRVEIIYKANHA